MTSSEAGVITVTVGAERGDGGCVVGDPRVREGSSLMSRIASDTLSMTPGAGVGLFRVTLAAGAALGEPAVANGRECRIRWGLWIGGAFPRVSAVTV